VGMDSFGYPFVACRAIPAPVKIVVKMDAGQRE
jgi:hypothetical protein